jgi:hypothetical protein
LEIINKILIEWELIFLSLKNKKILVVIVIAIILFGIVCFAIFHHKKLEQENSVSITKYEYFVLYYGDKKVGVIDKNGNTVIDPIYTDIYIPNPQKDVFICFNSDSSSKVINSNGDEIFEGMDVTALVTSESSLLELEKQVLKFKEDDLYGLINLDGEIILKAEYDEISSVKNRPGRILVKKDDMYGVVDSKGNTVVPVSYYSIIGDEYCSEKDAYKNTGFIVSTKSKTGILYGYYNKDGKKILDTKYEDITRVLEYSDSATYLIVMSNGKKGVLKNGKKIIDLNYQDVIYSVGSEIFIVNKNGKYGFFSKDGREILEAKYKSYQIAGDYISVEDDNTTSLYDKNGNYIDQKNYTSILEVGNSEYFIAVSGQDGTYSIISKEKNINNNYKNITYLFDELFAFTNENDKCGIIDASKGVEVLEAKYDIILKVDGINAIEARTDEGEVTIYSENLDEVCTMSEAIVENVNENFATAYNQNERIYLDKNGKEISNTQVYKNKSLYAFKENGKWGFKTSSGTVVIEPKYTMVTELSDYGFAGIYVNGKWGVINSDGEVIVEPSYTIDSYYFPKFIGKYLYEQTETIHCVNLDD